MKLPRRKNQQITDSPATGFTLPGRPQSDAPMTACIASVVGVSLAFLIIGLLA
jgi:hypothetical protein